VGRAPIAKREGWRARKDGSQYWAHTITTALRGKNSDLLGFAQVIREAPDRQSQNGASASSAIGQTAKVEQPIVAESLAMREVLHFARRVAESEASTILLEGESGTGKDLVAQMIHQQSRRRAEPFIAINCAAIPETLLESELFGYEKGAFTDARAQKRGVLELAHRGTLFLDEVGELPRVLQTKLLRVIEEQSFRRLGGLKEIQVDLRVVAATNKNLREAVESGAFRQDLYFRVNVIAINIPALRDRSGDILPLANFFVKHFNRRFNRQLEGISPRAAEVLLAHTWPGNVRELRNAIERAMILEDSRFVTLGSLPTLGTTSVEMAELYTQNGGGSDGLVPLRENEKNLLLQAIRKTQGNQTQAAKLLQITRDALRYKLRKHGLS
jgi:transcriptional regulator with PAS, ATPase and Fis domain